MRGIVYINGRYEPANEAGVSVFDRGFLFGDGVYEMCFVQHGHIFDEERHIDRFVRSLEEVRMEHPVSRPVLKQLCRNVIRKNALTTGHLYYHATRGAAKRDFAFPKHTAPSLLIMAWPARPVSKAVLDKGVSVITIPDQRWKRVDIKSLNLLAPVIGKQQAVEKGCFEAWQLNEQGMITEGTSSNAWIVTKDKHLITHPATHAILNGITRTRLLELATAAGYTYTERPFSVTEAKNAAEAFVSSTTAYLIPVVKIDDTPVGDGKVGTLALALRAQYEAFFTKLPPSAPPVP